MCQKATARWTEKRKIIPCFAKIKSFRPLILDRQKIHSSWTAKRVTKNAESTVDTDTGDTTTGTNTGFAIMAADEQVESSCK